MRRCCNGGITSRGRRAIQYDFMFQGVRYRPSLRQTPTEANLRRAREHLAAIKERIAAGSSVSWNLMIGKSPLWVSKQHGHRPETMFRA